jgi:hypothetical protein
MALNGPERLRQSHNEASLQARWNRWKTDNLDYSGSPLMILKGQRGQVEVLCVVVQRIRDVEKGCRKAKGNSFQVNKS